MFGGTSHRSSPSSSNRSSSSGNSSRPSFSGGREEYIRQSSEGSSFGGTPKSVSKQPTRSSFDTLAGEDARKVESRMAYDKANAPRTSYTTPAGTTRTIDPRDKQIEHLRGQLDRQTWINRQQREESFYRSWWGRPTISIGYGSYNDPYNPYWNSWLLSQPLNIMAMWVYSHQAYMDQSRLNALYAQNAQLQAEVAALAARGVPVDSTYTPPGVSPDLMYNDRYVNAAYNPQPISNYGYNYPQQSYYSGPSFGTVLLWMFVYLPLMLLVVYGMIYLMFIKRYNY